MWFALKEHNSRSAVAVAERYADGSAGPKVREVWRSLKKQSPFRWLLPPDAWVAATKVPSSVAAGAVNALVYPKGWLSKELLEYSHGLAAWRAIGSAVLRDKSEIKARQ